MMSSDIRRLCESNDLIPLYHYTASYLAPLIAQSGFRMSTQGQGDGGVYLSTIGPVSYGLGTPSYEDNIICDCFGVERLDEYRGAGRLNLCIMYAADPHILHQAPGGRVNAGMVTKSSFIDFSLIHRDGCYYLRSDRVVGMFLFDPTTPLPLISSIDDCGDDQIQQLIIQDKAYHTQLLNRLRDVTRSLSSNVTDTHAIPQHFTQSVDDGDEQAIQSQETHRSLTRPMSFATFFRPPRFSRNEIEPLQPAAEEKDHMFEIVERR